MLEQIRPFLPKFFGTYYEPFLGGGALFFDLRPRNAVLGDLNVDLIEFYRSVQNSPHSLREKIMQLGSSKSEYLDIRASRPKTSLERAARFYYLVALSFNGIYRVNRKGKFNVPFGGNSKRLKLDLPELIAAQKSLQGQRIILGDFEATVDGAAAGDFVYFDPPYTVAHDKNGFIEYNESIFSWADQQRLCKVATDLRKRGVYVLVSNATHHSIKNLYSAAEQHVITRASTVAANGARRSAVNELLVVLRPT